MPIIQKMLASLLLIALLPALIVSGIFYYNAKVSLHDQELGQVNAIATIEQSRIERLITRTQDVLNGFTGSAWLGQLLDHYNRFHTVADQTALQRSLLETQAVLKSFKTITLLNPAGLAVASTQPQIIGRNYADQAYFVQGRQHNDLTSHIYRQPNGNPGLYMVGPVRLNGVLVGVAVIDWDTTNLLTTAKDYAGLRDTGEIALVRADSQGNAVYLTPLRFDKAAVLRRTAPKTDSNSPAIRAINHQEGTFTNVTDYRGQPILAATRYIPDAGWGLIVKIDQAEAYKSLGQLSDLLIIVMFILSVLVIFIAFFLARRLNEPILTLALTADKIRAGDLSARAHVSTKDEIGHLAANFNAMARNIEKIDQMKTEFVFLTSHQLRTPATAVKGFLAMLLDGYAGKLTPKQTKLLKAGYAENERQISVINSILDVARMEAGEMALLRTMRDISQIIEASIQGQASLLDSHGQTLTFVKPKRPIQLWVDADKLQLVIDNLIHNAIKYSPRKTKITITLKQTNSQTTIEVRDQGVGIARRDIPHLFKRFSRLANAHTSNIQGAGLGLYLAEKLINMHGGSIRVQSRGQGAGTSFTITLPNLIKEDAP